MIYKPSSRFYYALTPAPGNFTAAGSSGQRGRGAKSRESGVGSTLQRSNPAQAIIAALSVQSLIGGATSSAPRCSASAERRLRSA